MAKKADLKNWVVQALSDHGGAAQLLDVAKHIWGHHENELRSSGDLFYTWQYDMRWAATRLRHEGRMVAADKAPSGMWHLAEK